MKSFLRIIIAMTACLLFVQCGKHGNEPQGWADYLPSAPEYADPSQWHITDRGAQADIFYITSTETGDYTLPDGTVCHYADTYNDSTRQPILSEMQGVDALLSGSLNYYSPYYRQCSLQTFTSDSLVQARLPIASEDMRCAFKYYLDHLNHGRPFVLAGYSQGAMIMLDLMKDMDADTRGRMIAAYAIGVAISSEDLKNNPHIIPASGADDTGVTICYNSVHDVSCVMTGWERSAVAINPVNWHTDATPATLITEPSPLIPLDQQHKDTLTVTLDPTSGLLLVDGYTGTDYILPLIGKEGNYHSREIWLYRDLLRDNIALRTNRYLNH
ncbi:MAG: DUF3089 domain-containing protein [Muribaculaceae bacterium]|nr:DUF3089 domain-containing protein [Muribaculaceae bacterium]